jgi:hypothetical protein
VFVGLFPIHLYCQIYITCMEGRQITPQHNCGNLPGKTRKSWSARPNNPKANGVRIELNLGDILQPQASDLRIWVAFVLGDCDQRCPSTIPSKREPVRRPAAANRSFRGIPAQEFKVPGKGRRGLAFDFSTSARNDGLDSPVYVGRGSPTPPVRPKVSNAADSASRWLRAFWARPWRLSSADQSIEPERPTPRSAARGRARHAVATGCANGFWRHSRGQWAVWGAAPPYCGRADLRSGVARLSSHGYGEAIRLNGGTS